jgi:hypothetical protein
MKHTHNKERSFSFGKKLLLISVFFILTPVALVSSVLSLIAIANSAPEPQVLSFTNIIEAPEAGVSVFASLPSDFPSISGEVVEADARPELIRNYLAKYNSPMEPYANYLVHKADEHGLDWRLTTAIAMKESGLGKLMPYDDCNNAWGYGIHSKGILCFDTWEEGIETVSRGLKTNYIDKGYVTVEEIMSKYAHPDSTTWADGVEYYMNKIK